MKAVVLHAEGEFPTCDTVPDPGLPRKGQMQVKVAAAGLNFADSLMRRGFYQPKPQFPYVVGLEYSGVVEAVGPETPGWELGSNVMGMGFGTAAEHIVVEARGALPVPQRFSLEEAAGFPVVFITAFAILTVSGRARAGETVLIHAAAGGVGTAAIQIAKHLGLNVIACASTDEKLQRVRELGADFTINYSRDDFVPLVKQYTSGRGTDIVIESVGRDFVRRSLSCMAPLGRIVIIGRASGPSPPIDSAELFPNCASISAFWLMALTKYPALLAGIIRPLLDLVARSDIRPIIGGIYTCEETGEALRALESRATYGKLVVRPV